ncbi:alpha/beta hydrolase [Catellatospora tritici]|uniref:alpha/beta hydrolase n=1 Tax=Catellatospora tritici TaxID=2851566 RepID=UPI001C2D4C0B|nr:alpha/beta hydrolase [Catellatospora tritici]MBV1854605.1 alpha/beta hydrolase family protein [Catellatospora tritici]
MVTITDLRDLRHKHIEAAAQAWDRLADDLDRLNHRVVDELTGPTRSSGWYGTAATAAYNVMDRLDDEYELAAIKVRVAAAVLHETATRMRRLQDDLHEALAAAAAIRGLSIDDHGRVRLAPALARIPAGVARAEEIVLRLRQLANNFNGRIDTILANAADLDTRSAAALRAVGPQFPGQLTPGEYTDATADARKALQLLHLSETMIPTNNNPTTAAAWWKALPAPQQALLLAAYPDKIGALDGLPATDRDRANRLALHNMLASLQPTTSGQQHAPEYTRLVRLRDRLEASEYGPKPHQLFLLGLDNVADGQAIVAIGNPDTAAHTAILVPGVSTNLDGMGGQIDRAQRMLDTADDYSLNGGAVSVIAWLGYDPPSINVPDIATAPFGAKAADGAQALDTFVDGLRTAHSTSTDHITAVGHSYGSTLLGHAATHGNGLAVDDILTVGSPGMRTPHAADLNVGATHTWAGAASDDPIANPQNHAAAYTGIPIIGPLLADTELDIHGISPHQAEFGANQFHVDTHGHSGYWDLGSKSLANIGAVIAGRPELTTLDRKATP